MERMVFEEALKGDVATLKRLLDDYPLLLEETMTSVYSYTPLHVAAILGYEDLAKEILTRKPELAKELNSKRSSPLHLAAAMGHVGVVRCLLLADRGMCKARDRDGLTPFHLAAVKGRVEVLKELMMMSDGHEEICSIELSEVIEMDSEKLGESILHMCVKHGQLEALKLLVEMIGDADFVNSKDALGNTVLHLAVEYKQFEAVKFLVQHTRIQVKAENGKGLTAMDTLFQTRNNNGNKEMEIGEVLVLRRDKEAKESHNNNNKINEEEEDNNSDMQSLQSQSSSEITKKLGNNKNRRKKHNKYKKPNNNNVENYCINELREGLMVAASLLATMAFQAIVSPPGSVMQETKPIDRQYVDDSVFLGFLYAFNPSTNPYGDALAPASMGFNMAIIGESVMSHYKPTAYNVFVVANTLSFLASLSVILLLISGLPLWHKFFMYVMMITMWVAITAAGLSYATSLQMITSWDLVTAYKMTFIWACLFATLAGVIGVGHIVKVIVVMIKWLLTPLRRGSKKKKMKNSSSMVSQV